MSKKVCTSTLEPEEDPFMNEALPLQKQCKHSIIMLELLMVQTTF